MSGLADLHAYMKYQNYVTRFSFPYFDMPEVAKGFEPRQRPEDELPYKPKLARREKTTTAPSELKQVPEPYAPAPVVDAPQAAGIQPEVDTADELNEPASLILRG